MFQTVPISPTKPMRVLLDILAGSTSRPRYAFMLLSLIAEVARPDGSAGPLVAQGDALVSIRDWLSDALTPMGQRDPKRLALVRRVACELNDTGTLSPDRAMAQRQVEDEVRLRVRAAGKSNLSRVVSELVSAGLLKRHYQGYCVDHHNRGARRQAVYTLAGSASMLVRATQRRIPAEPPRQMALPL